MKIAVFGQYYQNNTHSIVEKVVSFLEQNNIEICFYKIFYDKLIENKVTLTKYSTFDSHECLKDNFDYLISIDVLFEYKEPKDGDWEAEFDYEEYAPLRAEIIEFAKDKNLPINLIVNKNGDPWPDKVKDSLIQKILNWFKGK